MDVDANFTSSIQTNMGSLFVMKPRGSQMKEISEIQASHANLPHCFHFVSWTEYQGFLPLFLQLDSLPSRIRFASSGYKEHLELQKKSIGFADTAINAETLGLCWIGAA